MRLTFGIGFILGVGLCRGADIQELKGLYQSILSSEDDSRIPKPEELGSQDIEDAIERANADEINVLLPLAKQCVQSHRQKIRYAGLSLFFGIRFRPDSSSLLEPYIDDLGPLLRDADQPTRNATILILSGTMPSAKALPYLAAHMNDKNTPPAEVAGAASGLLAASRPPDPATVRHVLKVVQERDQTSLTVAILKDVSLLQITYEEALNFIKSGLTDANPFVRRAAVEASGKMPKEAKAKLMPELLRVAQNPEETPETRSRAEQVVLE